MALGTRLNVLGSALKASWKEGMETGEGNIGSRAYNTVKDTMFGAESTTASKIAGGAIGAGVAGAGIYAGSQIPDHPILGTGALAIGGALAFSNPKSVMSMFGKEAGIAKSVANSGQMSFDF